MAATGFYYRTSSDGGSPATGKIANAAGSLIEVFDDFLASGPSAWSKTTNDTNDVTYTAPGGSQIQLNILDNTAHSTNFYVRARARVSGSPSITFPTPTQEAASGQGYCVLRVRGVASSSTDYDPAWVGIRTDRFMLFYVGGSIFQSTVPCYLFAAGDFPTLGSADPGLCGILGQASTALTTTSANDTSSFFAYQSQNFPSWPGGIHGYAEVAADGSTGPVPASAGFILGAGGGASLTHHAGNIPLGRVYVATGILTTATTLTNSSGAIRGYIPYLYSLPVNYTSLTSGDTFTDSTGATYMLLQGYAGQRFCAVMISDDEALP